MREREKKNTGNGNGIHAKKPKQIIEAVER